MWCETNNKRVNSVWTMHKAWLHSKRCMLISTFQLSIYSMTGLRANNVNTIVIFEIKLEKSFTEFYIFDYHSFKELFSPFIFSLTIKDNLYKILMYIFWFFKVMILPFSDPTYQIKKNWAWNFFLWIRIKEEKMSTLLIKTLLAIFLKDDNNRTWTY